ncbi:MAG: hypothetical protein VR68_11700 [Peptococcaceae bacterium BRH_c4a]|nr:MAG: hypothetical protein VR68_11700 [Peptococcaceae bacterium BRH_c4a]
MPKKYIRNMETGKIELHFQKAEYQAMPEAQKKQLKSNFLFSGTSKAWVSRCKDPSLYHAIQTAKALGFTDEERTGERLSFAEQQERKAERAEARAERFEGYADNATKRAESLQAEFNECRKDWSWLTQPIMSGHAGSQRFGRQREKIMARYDKGFEEYRKSEYFRDRAETARATAEQKKMTDRFYLNNRIKECEKNIKALTGNTVHYEQLLYNIENGIKNDSLYDQYTPEQIGQWFTDTLERIEAEIDKQAYFQNALDEIGGIIYNRENIKPGYIIKIRGDGCRVIKANPKTVEVRIISGGAAGMVLTYDYSEIQGIIKAEEVKPKQEAEPHPYHEGEILVRCNAGGNRILGAYQIIARTDKTIQIQQIQVSENKPMPGVFIPGSNPQRKKPTVRKYTNEWTVYDENDWQLYKYSEPVESKAC